MVSLSLAIVAAAASVASAATPAGFSPGSSTQLVVAYGNLLIDGQAVDRELVQTQPLIATTQRLTGTSYAVLMIDLDIPTDSPPQTDTLLHWMQTGLTPAAQSTTVTNDTGGTAAKSNRQTVFLLTNGSSLPPIAAYSGPSPPARLPLSHRYTQLLVDTSGLDAQASSTAAAALASAAQTRRGFDAQQVLQQAGLEDRVVAGNFFNVTNPGPVQQANSTGGAAATGTTTPGSGTSASATSTQSPVTGGVDRLASSSVVAAFAGLMALVFAL